MTGRRLAPSSMSALLKKAVQRWLEAGVIDDNTARRIREFESQRQADAGAGLPVILAWSLGGILLGAGILLFVAAHWEKLGPGARFATVGGMVVAAHAAAATASSRPSTRQLGTVLHAVGTVGCGAAIYLVAQIFHLPEQWPLGLLLLGNHRTAS